MVAASPPLTFGTHGAGNGPAPGLDKGTLARTLIGPCGQMASLPDRRQAYGSSPLVKSLHPPMLPPGHRSTHATVRRTGLSWRQARPVPVTYTIQNV
jgi:hypothetical protein